MKFSTFKRHIREGSKNIVRNGWMTIASIGAVTTTLILVGVFLALVLNMNEIAKNIEDDVEIKTLIERTASQEEILSVEDKLKEVTGVESVVFSSNEDELKSLVDSMGEEGQAWQLYEQDNPLSHAYIVRAANPEQTETIATQIEEMDYVSEVVYGQDVVDQLFEFTNYARIIGVALIAALVFTAIFLISNTIKVTIMARSTEIGIQKLVGATNGFIRWPFFIEGFLLGVLGSVIPIAVILGGYYYLESNFGSELSFSFVEILPFNPFAWLLSLFILVLGAIIGMWGSVMSVRKFLKV